MPEVYTVFGHVDHPVFQQCVEASEYVKAEYPNEYQVNVEYLLPFEAETRCIALHQAGRLAHPSCPVVVVHGGSESAVPGEDFIAMILKATDFRLFDLPDSDPHSYRAVALKNYKQQLKSRGNAYTWMVVRIDGVAQPKMVFELFSKQLPRTCENFVHLCRGDLPDAVDDKKEKIRLSYKGSNFFRVVKGGWVQGGDIVPPRKGNGGFSCFGRTFPDESFDVHHDAKGILGMCSEGEGTNASSFYITLSKSSWMDRSYVAFGRVVEGLHVLDAIAAVEAHHNQTPKVAVEIIECGEVSLD